MASRVPRPIVDVAADGCTCLVRALSLRLLDGGIICGMRVKIAAIASIVMLVAVTFALNATNPTAIGPAGILAVFVCIYIFFLCVFYLSLALLYRLRSGLLSARSIEERVSDTKLYYFATVLALAPVIYLGMRSIGSISILEIALLFLFEALACFFIYRRY